MAPAPGGSTASSATAPPTAAAAPAAAAPAAAPTAARAAAPAVASSSSSSSPEPDAAPAAAAAPRETDLLRKTVRFEGLAVRTCLRDASLSYEYLAGAEVKQVFERVLMPALLATQPFLEIRSPTPHVYLTMHRGDALERGAELAVFLIDAPQASWPPSPPTPPPTPPAPPAPPSSPPPTTSNNATTSASTTSTPLPHLLRRLAHLPQVHFTVHEKQLHLVAKFLEYSFNFSRFLPNWRAQPACRLHRGAAPELVREWWRWALQGVQVR